MLLQTHVNMLAPRSVDRASSMHRNVVTGVVAALPILGNVKAPLKLEMLLLIVINKVGDGVVVAAGEHARWISGIGQEYVDTA